MINILDNKLINPVTRQQEAKVTLQEAWKEVQQKYHRSDNHDNYVRVDSFADDTKQQLKRE